MDDDVKNVLLALTESIITLTHAAYYGHEMAFGCYQMLVAQNPDPPVALAEYRKGLYGAGKLIRERDELIERLQELRQKLSNP